MKIRWTLCAILVALVGFAGPGCDALKQLTGGGKKEEEADTEEGDEEGDDEDEDEEDEDEDEEDDEDDGDDEESEDAGDGKLSLEDYVETSVKLACVESELGEEDKIDLEEVEEEILGEYGFDKDSYEDAEERFDGVKEADSKIEKGMEDCTTEKAKKYAGLIGDDDSEEEKEEAKAPQKPKSVGNFKGRVSNSGGFDTAILQISISSDWSTNGSLRGKHKGEAFRISFSGNVTKSNQINASGSSGGNSINVSGSVGQNGVTVQLRGSINGNRFSTSMSAN